MSATCPRCGSDADDAARFCQTCGAAIGEGEGDLVGKVLARKYRVIDKIGEGSMGRIYRGEHLGLEKRVALKVLHREVVLGAEGLQRFRREGVAAGKLNHPNAIEVYDFDVTEAGDAFMAMEFVEGRDIRTALEDDGPFELEGAQDIVLQALDALGHAHKQGIVHRDLKPENMMLVDHEDGPIVKVLDFGLSKLVDTRVEASLATVPGRIIGTPFYMAPEQSSGEEADARTDLYALGVIFYELLAGQRPFTGRNLSELLYAQATQEVPSIMELSGERGLPPWVDAFIERALERDREDRYQSAEAMARDLREEQVDERDATPRERPAAVSRISRGTRGGASRGRVGSRDGRRDRRADDAGSSRPAWMIPAGIAGVVGVAAVAFALTRGGGGDEGDGASATASATTGGDADRSAGTAAGQASDAVRLRLRTPAARNPADESYLSMLDNAKSRLQAGDLNGADALIGTAMGLLQRDPEAYFVRARILEAQGDLDGAASDLRASIAEDPAYAEAMGELGWLELLRGRSDDATAQFEKALSIDGELADALAGKGTIAAANGDPVAAVELFDRAIAGDRNCWRAHVGRGEAALERGDTDSAIESYVEGKRVMPRSKRVLQGLGRAYLAAGRVADATTQYEAALDVDANDADVVRGLCAAYLAGERYRDVTRVLGPAAGRGDIEGNTRALLALARQGIGDEDGARRVLRDTRDAGLSDARAFALLGLLELQGGDAERAMRAGARAGKLDEGLAEGHLVRGLALFRLERYEAAEVALREAVAADSACTAALFALGDLGTNYLLNGGNAVNDLKAYGDAGGDDPRAERWLRELGAL